MREFAALFDALDATGSKAEKIAAAMGVRELRVTRSDHNAGVAKVVIVRRDSLDVPAPLTWPVADADLTSLWFSVPVGVDENGKAHGYFEATGVRPSFMPRLESAGIRLPASAFRQRIMMRA